MMATIKMKYILLTLSVMCSLAVKSQETTDSVSHSSTEKEIEVKISMSDFTALNKEKDEAMEKYNNLLIRYNALLRRDSLNTIQLQKLNMDYPILKKDYESLIKKHDKADKCLINIASNFLYIPYEAYSVEKIAIPAFDAVSNLTLKDKHVVKYKLLKSYQDDVKAMLDFITTSETELGKPFTKNANVAFANMKNTSFYVHYNQYDDWRETFLGKRIILIENQFKTFDGSVHKLNFGTLKKELNTCLKTIEDL